MLFQSVAVAAAPMVGAGGLTDYSSAKRIALVIGNGKYETAPLLNPVNDATAIAAALKRVNFDVQLLVDAGRRDMLRGVRKFSDDLRKNPGAVGLLFYAGHGIQLNGENFLIPIGTDIQKEVEVMDEGISLGNLVEQMGEAERKGMNIIILDACRNNPFVRSSRSVAQGLATINAPQGTLIAFATAPGKVASDGDGSNGLYTQYLLDNLGTPEIKIEDAFKRVANSVISKSQGFQVPWVNSSLKGDFYFVPPKAEDLQARSQAQLEIDNWRKIKSSTNPADFQAFLKSFPDGDFSMLAKMKLSQLSGPDPEKEKAERARQEELARAEKERAETAAWQAASSGGRLEDMKEYLSRYPDSKYAAEAKSRLAVFEKARQEQLAKAEKERQEQLAKAEKERQEQLAKAEQERAEAAAWQAASAAGRLEDMKEFMSRYPSSRFAPEAQKRLAILEKERQEQLAKAERERQEQLAKLERERAENAAWQSAQTSGTLEDIKAFVARYPAGLHGAEAQKQLMVLEKARQEQLAKAEQEHQAQLAKAERDRAEAAAWQAAVAAARLEDMQDFVKRYPDSRFKQEAQTQITLLEKARQEQLAKVEKARQDQLAVAERERAENAAWQVAQSSGRLEDMREFVGRYPSSKFAPEAQKRLAVLEKARQEQLAKAEQERQAQLAKLEQERAEASAWQTASVSGRLEDMKEFVGRYPSGKFAPEAQKRLASMEKAQQEQLAKAEQERQAQLARAERDQAENAAWQSALAAGRVEDIKHFMTRFPASAYLSEANTRLVALEKERQAQLAKAEQERQAQLAKAEWDQAENAAWQSASSAATVEDWQAFIQRYPDSAKRADAEKQMASLLRQREEKLALAKRDDEVRLAQMEEERQTLQAKAERERAESAAWKSAVAGGRLVDFQDFVRRFPESPNLAEAKNRVEVLEAERQKLAQASATTVGAKPTAPTQRVQITPDELAGLPETVQAIVADGQADSCYEVGVMYEKGISVPRNMALALRWYTRAAKAGFAMAQYKLATIYEKGSEEVPRDYMLAVQWMEKATQQGFQAPNRGLLKKR